MSKFDEDLALAISLSLQDQHERATNTKDDPIIIDSSDDEGIDVLDAPPLSRNLAGSSSTRVSSVASKSTPSIKIAANPNKTIDLDSTLDVDDDTATEDDSATEDESDEDAGAAAAIPPVIGKGKGPVARPSRVVGGPSPHVANGGFVSVQHQGGPAPSLSPLAAFRAERAKLEQERLSRLKRRRPDLPSGGPKRDEDDEDGTEVRPSKRSSPALTVSSSASVTNENDATNEKVYAGSFNVPDKSGLFWHGALRQTANKHVYPSQDKKPVFRLTTDILPSPAASGTSSSGSSTTTGLNALSFAILSTYSLDLPWLYSLFPPEVPVIIVTQPGQSGQAEVHHTLPGWVRTSPGLTGGWGCMHVKLMMLFYKSGRLRIVIPTANFEPYDWRDIENSVWLQDVPLRTGSAPPPARAGTSTSGVKTEGFAERLERVLKALNVAPALEAHLLDQAASGEIRLPLRSIDELHSRWDWSLVTAHLIPSVAGKHTGWPAVLKVGHVALMKAVRDMGAASDRVKIECQGSSIGTYSPQWTNEFMSSAKGISPDKWLDVPKGSRSKAPHPSGLQIVFPSLRTVDASVLGRPGGGTMFCSRRQWGASTFPKDHFVDSNSKRGKVLMHSKMILGVLDDKDSDVGKPKGWLYVGSHNFTPSAWGNLSGSGFTPNMNITNYELGIVMPLESAAQGDDLACWKRPARPYIKGEDEPWMQNDHM